MSATQDPPIVVSGGSVTLEYDENQLASAGNNKRYNGNKKIHHVTIERNGTVVFDEDIPDGRVKVTVRYRNGNSNP